MGQVGLANSVSVSSKARLAGKKLRVFSDAQDPLMPPLYQVIGRSSCAAVIVAQHGCNRAALDRLIQTDCGETCMFENTDVCGVRGHKYKTINTALNESRDLFPLFRVVVL
jgi:hypothetical protein